jgi:methylenetetrahydrofolate dehydrogenase (NADP+)/methenyltetrahydrofolate cyclohydrolase
MILIDGKKIAADIRGEMARVVSGIMNEKGEAPHLAAILVGDDPASHTYVQNKEKACNEIGMLSSIYKYPADISEIELLKVIDFVNHDDEIHGLIVQKPLPPHISEDKVVAAINPAKDVDGFHPINVGRMVLNLPAYLPATPAGILELIRRYHIETDGKECVIMGRSNLVGSPLSIMLSKKSYPGNCTVTLCHSKTRNIGEFARRADILITAMGQPGFVTAEMVKKDAVVIDVGIIRIIDDTRNSGFRLTGDVKFDEVASRCSYITPVPGGVGPMTIVSLLLNTIKAYKKEIYQE